MEFYKYDHEITIDDVNNYIYPNKKVGVIIYIENNEGRILLQQRGMKSRDENGLYEDIGGKVEEDDINYIYAINRELREEAGDEVNIDMQGTLGIYHCYKNDINWVFIIFSGKYINGEIKIMEKDKCLGYRFFNYEEAINSDLVSKSSRYLIRSIHENYK